MLDSAEQQQQQHEMEHRIPNVAAMLLSMQANLSDDAAYAASVLAHGHCHVAQYVIEQASSQMPVCRHLLTDGCYRADCTYSHDIDHHTCVFWLKSHCSKGPARCRFLHGFSEKLLENLPDHIVQDFYSHQQGHITDEYYMVADGVRAHYDTNGMLASPEPVVQPTPPSKNSFANIASLGYNNRQSFVSSNASDAKSNGNMTQKRQQIPTTLIPQNLWNAHENRDASAFYIADPIERYTTVSAAIQVPRVDVIDLHFQSMKTFPIVLDTILPQKFRTMSEVWIITGTGHHVGTRTHQKGGSTLENAVLDYLLSNFNSDEYTISKGRDRNGQGGAIFIQWKTQKQSQRRII
jgi:Smr domain